MYETPNLIRVGKAEEVILGLYNVGYDSDGLFMVQTLEFAQDSTAAQD